LSDVFGHDEKVIYPTVVKSPAAKNRESRRNYVAMLRLLIPLTNIIHGLGIFLPVSCIIHRRTLGGGSDEWCCSETVAGGDDKKPLI